MGSIARRGKKLYILWYDGHGKRRQEATAAKNERQAKAIILEREQEAQMIRDGRLVQAPGATDEQKRQRAITLRDLIAQFLGDVKDDPGYVSPRLHDLTEYRKQARSVFKRLSPALLDKPAASITRADMERLRDELAIAPVEVKPAPDAPKAKGRKRKALGAESICHTLNLVGKVYNWARKQDRIACATPTVGVEKERGKPVLDYLEKTEIGALVSHLDKHGPRLVEVMAHTVLYAGLRRGELYGLKWPAVDLAAARIDVLHSYEGPPKNGRKRHVPISPELVSMLRKWKAECPATPDALVFPVEWEGPALGSTLGSVPIAADATKAERRFHMGTRNDEQDLAALLVAAGIPKRVRAWHLLRHTYASHLVMAGVPLYTVGELLGHSSPEMTAIYAHLSPGHLAAEVARLDYSTPAPAGVTDINTARKRRSKSPKTRP